MGGRHESLEALHDKPAAQAPRAAKRVHAAPRVALGHQPLPAAPAAHAVVDMRAPSATEAPMAPAEASVNTESLGQPAAPVPRQRSATGLHS